MKSLRFEVEPFGIHTTIVERVSSAPSCSKRSQRPTPSCRSTTAPSAPPRPARLGGDERQASGDPAKLAKALVTVVDQEQPPLRWVAGADAVETVEQKANDLLAQVDAYRSLSSSLAFDEA